MQQSVLAEATRKVAGSNQLVTQHSINALIAKKYIEIEAELLKLTKEQKEHMQALLNKQLGSLTIISTDVFSYNEQITAYTLNSDKSIILIATRDKILRLFNFSHLNITYELPNSHTATIHALALSKDGRYASSASTEDGTLRLWDLSLTPVQSRILANNIVVDSLHFTANGHFVLAKSDKVLYVWDISQNPPTQKKFPHGTPILTVAISPSSQFILTGSTGAAFLFDLTEDVCYVQPHDSPVTAANFSHDSRRAVTCTVAGKIYVWELVPAPKIPRAMSHPEPIRVEKVCYSPNDQQILTSGGDTNARLWNLSGSLAYGIIEGHEQPVADSFFSPDGGVVVTLTKNNVLRYCDRTQVPGMPHFAFGNPEAQSKALFSADGTLLYLEVGKNHASLSRYRYIPAELSLIQALLIEKTEKLPASLDNDAEGIKALQNMQKKLPSDKYENVAQIINTFFYQNALIEKECPVCMSPYEPIIRGCMILPCCNYKQTICKACLEKLGNMTYSAEWLGYRFDEKVKSACPFCKTPTSKMGVIKPFEPQKQKPEQKSSQAQDRHCSHCHKADCSLHCGACKKTYYCSKECQMSHWKDHKINCKKI